MSLDLAHVNAQLDPLLQRRAPAGKDHQEALLRLQQGLTTVPCPTAPDEYVALATDGSQIELDRHAPLQCYLINVGEVTLRYGPASRAALSSAPRLAAEDASASPQEPVDDDSAEAAGRIHIDLERSVAELEGLLTLTKATPDDAPALALQDGSLMLWIYSYQSDTELYVKQYVDYLDQLRLLAQARTLAVASYASAPRSREYLEKEAGYPKTERELLDRDVFNGAAPGRCNRSEVFKKSAAAADEGLPANGEPDLVLLREHGLGDRPRGGAGLGALQPRSARLHPRRGGGPVPPELRVSRGIDGGASAGSGDRGGPAGLLAAGLAPDGGAGAAGGALGQIGQQAGALLLSEQHRARFHPSPKP